MKKVLIASLALLLAACGSGIKGTYEDEAGVSSYTFESGGKVSMTVMGTETEAEYRVEDGKVKVGTPMGTVVMTIQDDGSLRGPMGMKLIKRK